jgi:2-keto-3-deoxy-L-rhamnonate aldolase RhmA
LVELDRDLAASAQAGAAAGRLDSVDVICADAGVTDVYAGAVPAELVLVCGVLGNISDADVQRTIESLPQLCARGGTVIWTRHRRHPDLTPSIRRRFNAAGFHEHAFESPGPNAWSVGIHSLIGDPEPLAPGTRLFTFVR